MQAVTIRIRSILWFATGAAVVLVAVGVFHSWRAEASTSGASTFVPITPCRLIDTRPTSVVGRRVGPLGPAETYSLQVTGNQGMCAVPHGATAVAVNLTAIGATRQTFVTVFPDDSLNPGTSALNMAPGQPPTPNKVDVRLSTSGGVKLYNDAGSVHLIGDVMGYYVRATGSSSASTVRLRYYAPEWSSCPFGSWSLGQDKLVKDVSLSTSQFNPGLNVDYASLNTCDIEVLVP